MKKIFAMLAIAAMATTLMTACGDDEETADNTYRIEKKSNAWDVANWEAYDFTSAAAGEYIALNAYSADNKVYVRGWVKSVPGTYNYTTSDGDYMTYYDDNDLYVDVDGTLGEVGASYYNDWVNEESWSETINAFDLTALTIDGNWNEQATDILTAFNNYNFDEGEVVWASVPSDKLYSIKGTMTNIHWDAWSTDTKANNAKAKKAGFAANKVK